MIHAENSNKVAVLIPIYKSVLTASEVFSIDNTISVLADRDIYFVAPEKLAGWIEDYVLKFQMDNINAIYFADRYFSSIAGYNKLLMSSKLYKSFTKYEFVLFVQLDALVFSDCLNEWMEKKYSYIGAPWFYGLTNPEKPLRFLGVGNGGLSLRRVNDLLRVLSRPRRIPNITNERRNTLIGILKYIYHHFLFSYNFWPMLPKINEDMFWGMLVPDKCNYFRVPPPSEAIYFAFETEPRYLYELTHHELPFGCHAWERYDYPFWKTVLRAKDAAERIGRGANS